MKKGFYILLIMCAAITIVSCGGKTKSYTDMLDDEKDAIEKLKDKEGLEFLSDFPKDSIFKENQFVKLSSGLYLNIINQGTKDRAVLGSTIVWSRFQVYFLIGQDSIPADNIGPNSGDTKPVEFRYGYTYSSNPDKYNIFDPLICRGLSDALQYVGDSSYVKLIVPFKLMSSQYEQTGDGAYYKKVKFTFKK